MKVSNHAHKRMKERCGFTKKSQERMAKKAFEQGITHAQTKGNLNKWITSLYFKNRQANNIRIYGDNAYIFCGETLVTVIPVPVNLRKDMKGMVKMNMDTNTFKTGNKDDLTEAVHGLDIFTKNWCMNCAETDRKNDLVFNCHKCEFCAENGGCIVKEFANNHKHNYPMKDFGSMGQL